MKNPIITTLIAYFFVLHTTCLQAQDGEKRERTKRERTYALAVEGDVKSQYSMGLMYELDALNTLDPRDTRQNEYYMEAAKWYRKAAEQGHAEAQYCLGGYYSYGRGVPGNSVEAVKWYRKAAEQGHEEAQNTLVKLGEVFIELKGDIYCAAFSPDGKKIAIGDSKGTTRIYDSDLKKELQKMVGHKGRLSNDCVKSVAFSPDGRKIVTAGIDGTARIWDVNSGEEIHKLAGRVGTLEAEEFLSAVFSPDGMKVATSSGDGNAKIWDAVSGTELKKLIGHVVGPVHSIAFSPDGRRIVTAGNDKTVRIWDTEADKELRVLKIPDIVNSAVFSPDGKKIATASWDNIVRIWNAESGRELENLSRKIGGFQLQHVIFSPDGKKVAIGIGNPNIDGSQIIRIRDVVDLGNDLQVLKLEAGGGSSHMITSLAFSPDGKRIMATSLGIARIWILAP